MAESSGVPTFEMNRFEVVSRDVVWQTVDGADLLARIFEPAGVDAPSAGRPVVVEVHGGAWCDHDRTVGQRYNAAVASAGAVVVAIDFRMGPDHHHPAGSDDVVAAVDWVRSHAGELGVDADRVALVGSSSGGHLALFASLSLDHPVVGVAPLWPPVDPLARYRYAQERANAGTDANPQRVEHGRRLVANTESYFVTEEAMAAASVARAVDAGEYRHLSPVWLVHPELDRNVPRSITDDVERALNEAGGSIDIWTVPGEHHAFGHQDGDASDELNQRLCAVLGGWFATD